MTPGRLKALQTQASSAARYRRSRTSFHQEPARNEHEWQLSNVYGYIARRWGEQSSSQPRYRAKITEAALRRSKEFFQNTWTERSQEAKMNGRASGAIF